MPTATKDKATGYRSAEELMAMLNKKHGDGTIVMAKDMPTYDRITTGSLSYDVMLGGGWPVGQWHQIVGEWSNGKTALALKTIAANQRANPDFMVLWIAAEHFDKKWAAKCGVDLDRVIVYETRLMEQAYQAVLDFMENRSIDLVVIDSYPALIPAIEDDKEVEEATVGKAALVTNKFFRKMGQAIKRSLVEQERPATGLFINQWREKIGVMHGDPRTTPGGKGKDFSFYTIVSVRRTNKIERAKEIIGIEITAVTMKNKSAPSGRTAAVDFYFDGPLAGGYDLGKDMANTAIYLGSVKRAGKWYKFLDKQWNGKEAVWDAIREDLDLQAEMREQTLKLIGNVSTDPRVTEEDEDDDN